MGNDKWNIGQLAPKVSILAALMTLVVSTMLVASCNKDSNSPTTPTPVDINCQLSFNLQQSAVVPSAGGSGGVTITANPGKCSWTAGADVPWITVTPSSGAGTGEAKFTVAANPNDGARQGDVIMNDTRFKITQAGASCDVQLSPPSQAVPSSGISGTVGVMTGSSCTWSAISNVGWLVVMSDPTTTGEGTVQFTANANPSTSSRVGLIAIGNQLFTVTQAGR